MTGPMHRPEFREQGMPVLDFVREVLGDDELDDKQARDILWELTPYPIARGRDDLLPYLEQVRDGTRTFDSVYAEISEAVAAAHERNEDDNPPPRRTPSMVTMKTVGGVL